MNKKLWRFSIKIFFSFALLISCRPQPVSEFDPIEKVFTSQILQDAGGSYVFGQFQKQVGKISCEIPQYVPGGEVRFSGTCETNLRKESGFWGDWWIVEFKQVWSEYSELKERTHIWIFKVNNSGKVTSCTQSGDFPPQYIHWDYKNVCKNK